LSRIEFKQTGFIFLVFLASACSSRFPLPCSYVSNELEPHAGCAVREGAELKISEDHLKRLHFDADSLAQVLIDGQWFYVKPDGRKLPVVTYDNGADYFAEGLVRSSVGAQIAYFDLILPQSSHRGTTGAGPSKMAGHSCAMAAEEVQRMQTAMSRWKVVSGATSIAAATKLFR